MMGSIGIGYWKCGAIGGDRREWEFCLTIDGHRMSESIYMIVKGESPSIADLDKAFGKLMRTWYSRHS